MSTLPLSGVNSRFLAASRFPAFHLKCPSFLRISSWKNALYAASSGSQTTRQPASSDRQRDINDSETVYFVIQDHHLIVTCISTFVKFGVFCLLTLVRVAFRRCTTVPVGRPGGEKY